MAFDYKKEYKEFYMPKGTPSIVRDTKMHYIAVRGSGNPNDEDGEYKQAIGLLYGIAFTIKMSKKEDHQIDGYFDYVVPPLEGFWWQRKPLPQWRSAVASNNLASETYRSSRAATKAAWTASLTARQQLSACTGTPGCGTRRCGPGG